MVMPQKIYACVEQVLFKEAYPIWRIAVGCPIKADVAQGAIIRVVGGFGTYNGSCGSSNTF